VLVGSVVDDEIENNADVALFGFPDQVIEIGESTVQGIDGFIIGNVVAEINLGRRETRSDPDGVDAEIVEVIEFGSDSVQIADAVTVAVGETSRINFVKNRVLPPSVAFGIGGFLLGGR